MFADRNQVVLPLNLAVKIPENDSVRKLVEICDSLDYTELEKAYLKHWRKHNPATLFTIIVYGYMKGIYTSRKIEEACKTDIRFMWILGNEDVPDNSTIARFQNEKLVPAIEELFYQFVEKLIELGEVSYENVFVDGTKIEAYANKFSFVWAKAVEKHAVRLDEKIAAAVKDICARYLLNSTLNSNECLEALMNLARLQKIEFVYGKGKRKTPIQRDIDMLLAMGDKRHEYLETMKKFGKRKSFSKTDVDATFMRLKEDHMKNGQLKPAYNVQIAVESEYIVGVGLFPNPTDTTTLIPFLDRIQERSGMKIKNLVADAGYASEENFDYLERNGQNAYIKPQKYEVAKTRKYRNDIYRPEHMKYDGEKDEYICPNGKRLYFKYNSKYTTDNNYVTQKKVYECEDCSNCPHRSQCHTSQNNRVIRVSHKLEEQNLRATDLITSDFGCQLRMNRSIQVEGAFGVLKQDFGYRRFQTRGKAKTETQFFLLAFAFNVEKLCNRIESNRFGKSLFGLKSA